MIQKRKVLITIGYKKREFEYLSLFAAFLTEAGYEVRLLYSNFEIYYQIFQFQPDFIILGQVNQNENIAIAQYAKRSGTKIIVINQEGTYHEIHDNLCMLFGEKCNDYVDTQIVWGLQHLKDISRYSNIDSSKIYVCGTPKFDLYHPKIFTYFKHHPPYQSKLDLNKKTICLATSFQEADSVWANVENNIAYQELGQKKFEESVKYHKILRDNFISLAQQLVATNQYNIIFRPHPLEQDTYYQNKIADSKNIIFDNTINSAELFTVTDLLIHRTSTLATEAWIVGIPTISFDPIKNIDNTMLPFTRNEHNLNTTNQVISFLENWSKVKPIQDQFKTQKWQYLERWYGLHPKQKSFSAQKIIKVLNIQTCQPKKKIINKYIFTFLILNFLRRFLRKRYIYEVLGILKGKNYLNIMKANYILPVEVNTNLKKYLKLIKK